MTTPSDTTNVAPDADHGNPANGGGAYFGLTGGSFFGPADPSNPPLFLRGANAADPLTPNIHPSLLKGLGEFPPMPGLGQSYNHQFYREECFRRADSVALIRRTGRNYEGREWNLVVNVELPVSTTETTTMEVAVGLDTVTRDGDIDAAIDAICPQIAAITKTATERIKAQHLAHIRAQAAKLQTERDSAVVAGDLRAGAHRPVIGR